MSSKCESCFNDSVFVHCVTAWLIIFQVQVANSLLKSLLSNSCQRLLQDRITLCMDGLSALGNQW